MSPPPDPDRYFIALPDKRGQTFTREELFQQLTERKLSPRVMVALVNTSDWKKLRDLFPEWSPAAVNHAQPTTTSQEVEPQPWRETAEPPFYAKQNGFDTLSSYLMGLGTLCCIVGVGGCTTQRAREVVFGSGLFNSGLGLLLIAVLLKVLARILASNEASVRALNHLISLQEAKLTLSKGLAPVEGTVEPAAVPCAVPGGEENASPPAGAPQK